MPDKEDTITSLLDEKRLFPPSEEFRSQANIKSLDEYNALVKEAEKDLEGFWARQAEEHLDWYKKWDKVLSGDAPFWKWFVGGQLNASYNCLDRHLHTH
ncbi:MAG: acetyl-coenzyme A synthetase N-terminal domain-containing protein, partial [Anaerolineae bacterium]